MGKSLARTPEMLPVLKQAGVVDAGGKGLIYVLTGAYNAFLRDRKIEIKPQVKNKYRETRPYSS